MEGVSYICGAGRHPTVGSTRSEQPAGRAWSEPWSLTSVTLGSPNLEAAAKHSVDVTIRRRPSSSTLPSACKLYCPAMVFVMRSVHGHSNRPEYEASGPVSGAAYALGTSVGSWGHNTAAADEWAAHIYIYQFGTFGAVHTGTKPSAAVAIDPSRLRVSICMGSIRKPTGLSTSCAWPSAASLAAEI